MLGKFGGSPEVELMVFFRFLYLNIYAFALVVLGVLVFFIPTDIFVKVVKFLFAASFVFSGIGLFVRWKAKIRRMGILVARNRKTFRRDSFKEIRTTLCGLLMVHLVLRDLRKTENYISLSKAEWEEIRRKALGGKAKSLRKSRKHRWCFSKSRP